MNFIQRELFEAYTKNGKYHNDKGPAIKFHSGTQMYMIESNLHRIDGPAVIYANGVKEYWYDNIEYPEISSDEEWLKITIKLSLLK